MNMSIMWWWCFGKKNLWIAVKSWFTSDHGRHFILDSACNALYVFPDKTLRAQSENQSPRWCYQTEEKRDFFEAESSQKNWEKRIHPRCSPGFIQSSWQADHDIVTLILIQLVLLSPPSVPAEWYIWEHKNCIRPTPLYLQTFHTIFAKQLSLFRIIKLQILMSMSYYCHILIVSRPWFNNCHWQSCPWNPTMGMIWSCWSYQLSKNHKFPLACYKLCIGYWWCI